MEPLASPLRTSPPPIDMGGSQVGHWLVKYQAPSHRSRAQWLCVCTCGAERVFSGTGLRAMKRRGVEPCRRCGRGQLETPCADRP